MNDIQNELQALFDGEMPEGYSCRVSTMSAGTLLVEVDQKLPIGEGNRIIAAWRKWRESPGRSPQMPDSLILEDRPLIDPPRVTFDA